MKSLYQYINEEVAISIGDMEAKSTFSTPGNTMGMGDLKPPTVKEPGSDIFGTTRKEKHKRKPYTEKKA